MVDDGEGEEDVGEAAALLCPVHAQCALSICSRRPRSSGARPCFPPRSLRYTACREETAEEDVGRSGSRPVSSCSCFRGKKLRSGT
uniref:Uncharacterized protein n=1 Tax=Arundo donax TaxID=35708 RepID=A0A0A9DF68_ARUDO